MANEKRLIDANAWIEDHCDGCKYKTNGICNPFNDPVCGAVELMHDAPTVDAEEVVHGQWVFGTANHREYMKCSVCLKSQTPTGVFTYCPGCGAKMDGDGNG